MTLLKRLFGELFNQKDITDSNESILKEKIVHTEFFLSEFEQWKTAGMYKDLLFAINEQKEVADAASPSDSTFFNYRSAASNGFYFHGTEDWSNKDYSFLVEYFSTMMIDLGYRLNNASREVKQEGDKLISTEMFYFKLPLSSRKTVPYPQFWGNVQIEHKLIDERTNYIKVMAHVYSDRSYQDAYDFDDLELKLLNPDPI